MPGKDGGGTDPASLNSLYLVSEKFDLKKRHHQEADYLQQRGVGLLLQGNGHFGVQLPSRDGLSNLC